MVYNNFSRNGIVISLQKHVFVFLGSPEGTEATPREPGDHVQEVSYRRLARHTDKIFCNYSTTAGIGTGLCTICL